MNHFTIILAAVLGFLLDELVYGNMCGPRHLPVNYRNISFYSNKGPPGPYRLQCTWEIDPPRSDDFVFIVTFLYLTGYEKDDEIFLPDGTVMPRNRVYKNSTICYKFALKDSFEMPCVKEIARDNCVDQPFNRTLKRPIKISVSTHRDQDNVPGFNFYTDFYASLKFLSCIDQKSYHQEGDERIAAKASSIDENTSIFAGMKSSSGPRAYSVLGTLVGICSGLALTLFIIGIKRGAIDLGKIGVTLQNKFKQIRSRFNQSNSSDDPHV